MENTGPDKDAPAQHRLPVATLERRRGARFALEPDAEARAALAGRLGIEAVRKLSFAGSVMPEGRDDWRLEARLGATVVQPCGVTLAPVTTRIEEDVMRRFLAHPPVPPEGGEVEMPEDETEEPLGEAIDLRAVMEEALALALPPFPRAEGAELGEARFTEPGRTPLRDDDVKPLAGLKALRDSLDGDG